MTEWRVVPNHPDYDVSDDGRVRSRLFGRTHVLRPHLSARYPAVQLAGAVHKKIHWLVAEAFLGPRPEGMVIRHLDGDNANNKVSNLTYGTPSENSFDTIRHGRRPETKKTECVHGHPYTPENTIYRAGNRRRHCRECQRERGRALSGEALERKRERNRLYQRAKRAST